VVTFWVMVVLWAYEENREVRRSTDVAFILREGEPSPDGQHIRLVYQYDTGAFGYSRVWWAVAPIVYEGLNLARYELPDGYKAKGWSDSGDLIVEQWKPYYYPDEIVELKTGDRFHGVRVQVGAADR
jgi:hypothetical protein